MATVGEAWVDIKPSARGFGSQLDRDISGEVGAAGKSAGSKFGTAMKVGALAAIGGAAVVGNFLKGAIDQASDLAESTTKVDAIFGSAASNVQKFADSGARALGQTKLEVLSAASTFGTFGKAAGLSGRDLAKFSTDFTGLATDLASFNNTTPEQAVQAIGAALRGEAEPMRQFGVLLDDATLRNEALKLGLIKTTKDALTPQQKVLAAQAAIYKQTQDAQGDFQRTSGGLANQQRILSASFSDLKTQLGTALLPLATSFFTFLNDKAIPAVAALGPAFQQVQQFLAPFVAQIQSFFGSGGSGSGLLSSIGSFVQSIASQMLPVLQTMGQTFVGTVLPAVQQFGAYLAANLFPIFQQVAAIIRDQVVPILVSLGQFLYGTIYPAVIDLAQSLGEKLKPVFDAIFQVIQTSVLPTLNLLLAKFREHQPTIEKVVGVIVKVIAKVLEFAAAILGKVLPPLIQFQGAMLQKVVPAIGDVIGKIGDIIGWLKDMGQNFVDGVKRVDEFRKGVVEKVEKVIGIIKDLPGDITSAIGDLSDTLTQAGRDVIQGLIDGINESKEGKLLTALTGVSGFIVANKGPESYDKVMLKPAGIAIIQGLIDGMRTKMPALGDFLASVNNLLAGGIAKSETKVAESMAKVLDKVVAIAQERVSKLQGVVDSIRSAFDSLTSSVSGAFSGDLFQAASGAEFFAGAVGQYLNLGDLKAALKKLRGFGLSGEFLAQLFASGNAPLILDLAAGSRADARFSQVAFEQSTRLAERLGAGVADARYGDKLDKQIDELRRINRQLEPLQSLASDLGKAINGASAKGRRRAA